MVIMLKRKNNSLFSLCTMKHDNATRRRCVLMGPNTPTYTNLFPQFRHILSPLAMVLVYPQPLHCI